MSLPTYFCRIDKNYMALILHIDTALQRAFVGLSRDGELMAELTNEKQNDHAAFVQPAIQTILSETGIQLDQLDAVGVVAGPGSYTGLRVGMSSAKGLCYALGLPLLRVSTLKVMAAAAVSSFPGFAGYCPMIDARRDEVYTAIYAEDLQEMKPAQALILTPDSFMPELVSQRLLFTGNGAEKWKNIMRAGSNAFFEQENYNGHHLARLLLKSFKNKEFCDIAYSEPFYLKDFHLITNKKLQ